MPSVIKIARPDEIPFGERYVLVMNGLSRHDTFHAKGATFVINNSPGNQARTADLTRAMSNAQEFAKKADIAVVHLIE